MEFESVSIKKPEELNFILGQAHFIKTVEVCEASGKALVRWSGTDDEMIALAQKNALALRAGHSFLIFLGAGYYPLNVLNAVKQVPEVARIFCATANPVEVILAETEQGRGILGVIDGATSAQVEGAEDIAWRKNFLRMIGYKL